MKILGYNMSSMFGNMSGTVISGSKLYGKTYFSLDMFFKTKRDVNPGQPPTFIYEKESADHYPYHIVKKAVSLHFKEHHIALTPNLKVLNGSHCILHITF